MYALPIFHIFNKKLIMVHYNNYLLNNILTIEESKDKFRVVAKNIFLTYPNADLDVTEVLNQLKFILDTPIIKDYCIAKVKNKNGNCNIYAYLYLHKNANTKNPYYFDLVTKEGNKIHGTYKGAIKPNMTIEYILNSVSGKNDPNLIYSRNIGTRLDLLGMNRPDKTLINVDRVEKAVIDIQSKQKLAK